MNLTSRLDELAALHPEKPAIIYEDKKNRWQIVTYRQLAEITDRFFLGLGACSLTPGMHAALMIRPSLEFFALTFAMLKFGLVPVIVDPAIGLKRLGDCLNESKPDIFIGNLLTHTLRIWLGWGKASIKHNLTLKQIKGQGSPLSASYSPDDPAAIIFTSGSTGAPKGVLYTRENFCAQLEMLGQTFNISPDEIDLPAFPLYALIDILLGVTSVIPDISFPVPGKTNPQEVIEAVQRFKVTNMFASPVVLDILSKYANQKSITLSSLRRVSTAGAPAPINLQERFRELLDDKTDLYGIYGATEALPIAKVESREIFSLKEKTGQGAGICLGKPVDGMRVRIIRITDQPIEQWRNSLEVESNVVGEITVQGPAVTRSYISGEEANQLGKIQNGEAIIHRMGDVGYFDEAGCLWYCGRKSQRVVTKDDVLFTEQIENLFNVHHQVYRTALVGVRHEPVLWVELKENSKANKAKIREDLMEIARRHPQAARIRSFLFMKRFPTDVRHNSKIIREKLTLDAEKRLS